MMEMLWWGVENFGKGRHGGAAIFHPVASEVDAEQVVQNDLFGGGAITLVLVFGVTVVR